MNDLVDTRPERVKRCRAEVLGTNYYFPHYLQIFQTFLAASVSYPFAVFIQRYFI